MTTDDRYDDDPFPTPEEDERQQVEAEHQQAVEEGARERQARMTEIVAMWRGWGYDEPLW